MSAADADPTPAVIPLFPLAHVLLPGMPLPLHVFEPRYRQLLADVTDRPGPTNFGIVALTRGSEVGTAGVAEEPEFAAVGTVAEVLEVQPYDDGASDLFTVGSRRFRVERLVGGKPYLQARVSYLAETDGQVGPPLREKVARLDAEHSQMLQRLTGEVGERGRPGRQRPMVLPAGRPVAAAPGGPAGPARTAGHGRPPGGGWRG